MDKMDEKVAHQFFADFFYGSHHFPSDMKPFGAGWCIATNRSMATTDFNELTRLVIMAHDRAIRVDIIPKGMNRILIALHQRDRSTGLSTGHPTLQEAVNKHFAYMGANSFQ